MQENKKKILVVEDERYLLEMYVEILQNAGYDVSSAGGGEEALNMAGNTKVDLILLDLMMPKVDGMQVLAAIKGDPNKYGNPLVIVLTNLSSEVSIKTAFNGRADGYLMKSELTPDQIIQEVNSVLNKGQ